MRFSLNILVLLRQALSVCTLLVVALPCISAETTLISVNSNGEADTGGISIAFNNGISENGIVAFTSSGNNLVPNDFNGTDDVFIRDVRNGITEMISVSSAGVQGNGVSSNPEISPDGRWVLFWSLASNLDRPDNENSLGLSRGIYLRDRENNSTELIGKNFLRSEFPRASSVADMSDDASVVVFSSADLAIPGQQNASGTQVYLYYRLTDELILVSQRNGEPGNRASQDPRISADGKRVVYSSYATNLLEEGSQNPTQSLSVFLYDVDSNTTELIAGDIGGSSENKLSGSPSIDDTGRWVGFVSNDNSLSEDDNNGEVNPSRAFDVFVKDTLLGTIELITKNDLGVQADNGSGHNYAMLTADGTGIAFSSKASNILSENSPFSSSSRNVYFKDLQNQTIELISARQSGRPASSTFGALATSKNGRYVAFAASDSELVTPPPAGILMYLRDRGASCAGNTDDLEFKLTRLVWELLSLPCLPPGGSTVESLFADDIPGTYFTDWRIYTFDPLINNYRLATLDQTIVHGQGFWMIQNVAPELTLTLPENSRSAGSSYAEGENCVSDIGCQSIPLIRDTNSASPISWNLLGNPYSTSSAPLHDDMRIVTPTGECGDGCALNEAYSNQTAFNVLYSYRAVDDDYKRVTSGESMNAWSGFWIGALGNSTEEGTRLVVSE